MATARAPLLYLVGIDGSAPASQALRFAIDLALTTGAKLRVVCVPTAAPSVPITSMGPGFQLIAVDGEKEAQVALLGAAEELRRSRAEAETTELPMGDPASRLVAEARRCKPALLILGSHGHRGLERLLLGSVAERVVREAPCPVLVVR